MERVELRRIVNTELTSTRFYGMNMEKYMN